MDHFIIIDNLEDLDAESKYLIHKAMGVLSDAYAPYSGFHVAAALLLEDGSIVTGTNQENASYPLCMCAERVALYTAAMQHPHKAVAKLAVVARRQTGKELLPATSCGGCRQVMLEFEIRQKKNMEVIMLNGSYQWVKAPSAQSLLPFSFTQELLERTEKK